ncbi:chloride channel protein [Tardiphaga sp.]|uniref:chloride channel protein n=1 Tax=Tardiphaga sp. TaxID=1926292 RepID=UPI00352B127B
MSDLPNGGIPSTLRQPHAPRFWFAIVLIGIGAGASAAALTLILQFVQRVMWPGSHETLLDAAIVASPWRHVAILVAAGMLTGLGQIVLGRLSRSNSIDITAAIWFFAGRMPALRTLGSALLSVIVVGMGASLGREGAPKQAGAVIANALSDKSGFSDEQRRLLVACGAGAGMAAAYGVPLGGALFSLEVLRGMLALRLVLPALMTSVIASAVAWLVLPDAPTYIQPAFTPSALILIFAAFVGVIAAFASVGFVRIIAIADRNRPAGTWRLFAPVFVLGLLGIISIAQPQLLGNGKDIVQMALMNQIAPVLLVALLILKPLATICCLGSDVPGGLFTPSLAAGALLGSAIGQVCALIWPDAQPGLFALLGAGAFIAATTQGPISSVVLLIELTGHDRSFIAPLIVAVVIATLIARTIDPRSIYDARLTDQQLQKRQELRDANTR